MYGAVRQKLKRSPGAGEKISDFLKAVYRTGNPGKSHKRRKTGEVARQEEATLEDGYLYLMGKEEKTKKTFR